MSFLDRYIESHQLDPIPEKYQEHLDKLEDKIKKDIEQVNVHSFDECIKKYGPSVADLCGRFSDNIKQLKPVKLSKIVDIIKFVYNISFESYQIIELMSGCVIPPDADKNKRKELLIQSGRDLVCFVWFTVDPLKDKFNWILFKKTIETKLVKWIAGFAMNSIIHLFEKGFDKTNVQTMSSGDYILKAV